MPLLAVLVAAPAWGGAPLLATVGDVTSTSAVLWVRSPAGGEVAVHHQARGASSGSGLTLEVDRMTDFTGKARLEGLAPRTRYDWSVSGSGARVAGEFVTAPAHDVAASVTFVWGGDLGGGKFCRPVDGGYRIFRAMAGRRPDVFFFVGDTVYADHRCGGPDLVPGSNFVATTLAGFRAKHRYNREDPPFRAFLAGASVVVIWDDHEVRNDFAGSTEVLMPVGRRAFLEYWPTLPPAAEPTRLYRSFRWGRLLEVFVLDTRQYRSPNAMRDGPEKTMLGPAQRRWIVDGVAGSGATWKVVVSSVSLSVSTGRTHRDSWSNASIFGLPEEGQGFATERDAILRMLAARGVRNLVFVVADVHHAEIIRHRPAPGFVLHELIAGPLSATHGRPRPLDEELTPRSLFGRGGLNTFGEVTVGPDGLTVRMLDEGGTILHTHVIRPE